MATITPNTSTSDAIRRNVVVATRIHLGKSTSTPPADLGAKVSSFINFCTNSFDHDGDVDVFAGVIAVDSSPKIEGYDLVKAVREECDKVLSSSAKKQEFRLDVLPVTPWGKFVPALNAIISYAATEVVDCNCIVFCSAETTCSNSSMKVLLAHMDVHDTLVVGALLSGHDYQYQRDNSESEDTRRLGQKDGENGSNNNNDIGCTCVELNGRTCPWNTLAVWNLKKLALSGFQLVSDGLLTDDKEDPSYGVEEVVATCLLQKLLGEDMAKAKLVQLPDVTWDQQFDNDPERLKWQKDKMKSKLSRAARQLELIGLSGKVYHY